MNKILNRLRRTSHLFAVCSVSHKKGLLWLCFPLLAGAVNVDSFPLHLKKELQKLRDNEDMERQLQEIERNTCKVELCGID